MSDELPARVVITGGATGIGLAAAKLYVEAGSSVGLIGRNEENLDAAVAQLGPTAVAHSADVGDEAALKTAVDDLAAKLGGIDALVAAAGTEGALGVKIEDVSAETFMMTLQVNVLGVLLAAKHALPYLKRSPGASITSVGSDSGFVAVAGMIDYNASKGAVVQMTRALAVELFDEFGIRVNSVCPSIVDTPMTRRALGDELLDNPTYPLMTPEDVAVSILYLSAYRARALNGVNLLSDFGYSGRSSFPA